MSRRAAASEDAVTSNGANVAAAAVGRSPGEQVGHLTGHVPVLGRLAVHFTVY